MPSPPAIKDKTRPNRQTLLDQIGQVAGTEKLRDVPMNRRETTVANASEESRLENVASHLQPQTDLGIRCDVVHGTLLIPQCETCGIRDQLVGTEPAGRVQQLVWRRGAIPVNVLLVFLGGHLEARHFERLKLAPRPGTSCTHGSGQQIQGERIAEETVNTTFSGFSHETASVLYVVMHIQDLRDVIVRKRIEPQGLHLLVSRHGSQRSAVVVA